MTYKIPVLCLFFFYTYQSCSFSSKNTSLGNSFNLSEYSIKEVQIMYCLDDSCNSGMTVVPQTIIAYNFNSDWIIAKNDSTYHNNKSDFAYWVFKKDPLINKTNAYENIRANLLGPLDSTAFYKVLSERSIQLKLINYSK